MINPALPYEEKGGEIRLRGPVFLSCGCGNVTARWATVAQGIATRIPQGKPKSSRIIHDWIQQEKLSDKWPELKCHSFGLVVAQTEQGWERVNIMSGTTQSVIDKIGQLLRSHNEYRRNHQTA